MSVLWFEAAEKQNLIDSRLFALSWRGYENAGRYAPSACSAVSSLVLMWQMHPPCGSRRRTVKNCVGTPRSAFQLAPGFILSQLSDGKNSPPFLEQPSLFQSQGTLFTALGEEGKAGLHSRVQTRKLRLEARGSRLEAPGASKAVM